MKGAADPLWHVRIVVSGAPAPMDRLERGLRRFCDLDPMNMGARYTDDLVELQFWDEGPELEKVAEAAAELWPARRVEAGLPDWSVTGLEVLEQHLWRDRGREPREAIAPGSVGRLV